MSTRSLVTLAGAAVGAFFGQPQLGFVIGSLLGNAVDPVKVYGPRLTDAKVQTARDGVPISWGMGAFRTAGTLIHVQPGPPTEHEEEEGGKGGGPVEVTYTYTRTFAVLVCEGPIIGIRRIWADQKPIYDTTPQPTVAAQGMTLPETIEAWRAGLAASSGTAEIMTVYLGNETQLPDPELEALFGAGTVNAYRGSCYVVFKDYDVTSRGGSIPNMEFEVVTAGSVSVCNIPTLLVQGQEYKGEPSALVTSSGVAPDVGTGAVPNTVTCSKNGLCIAGQMAGSNDLQIYRWNGTSYAAMTISGTTPGTTADGIGRLKITDDGATVVCPAPNSNALYVYRWNGATGYTNVNTVSLTACSAVAISPDQSRLAVSYGSFGVYYVAVYSFNPVTGALSGRMDDGSFADGWGALDWVGEYILASHTSSGWPLAVFNASADHVCSAAAMSHGPAFWDASGLYAFDPQPTAISILTFTGTALNVIGSKALDGAGLGTTAMSPMRDYLLSARTVNELFSVSGSTLTEIANPTPAGQRATWTGLRSTGGNVPGSPGWWQHDDGTFVTVGACVDPVTTTTVSLASLLTEICARSDLVASEINVSGITDLMDGFVVGRETQGDSLITLLGQGFFFDACEVDGKVVFVKRGGASVLTLDADDLVELDGPPVTETRDQEIERPRKINVVYFDPALAYIPTKQTAERRSGTVAAVGERTLEMPIVFDKDDAAQVADKLIKISWTDLLGTATFSLPDEFSYLVPTDIVTLSYRGRTQRLRIEKIDEENGSLAIVARQDRLSAMVSDAVGTGDPADPNYPTPITATVFAAMNLPYLRAQDNVEGVYLAACGTGAGWPGCVVQIKYPGNSNYQTFTPITAASVMGNLTAAATSSQTTLAVDVYGTMASVTDAQIANDANAFAILTSSDVAEVGQVKTVTAGAGAGLYNLSDVTRGLLAPPPQAHEVNERFVMLDSVMFMPLDVAYAGQTFYFRPVTNGSDPDNNVAYSFVYRPRGVPAPFDYITVGGEPYITVANELYYGVG